jgi:uncharacterized protein YndB with AHSA1/START domain
MEIYKITVTALISAPLDKVWDCYTSPDHITNWNFASDDWCCPAASNELYAGGRYVARMEAKDGSFGFDFEAVYDEVIPQERISYSMGKTLGEGRKATIEFIQKNNETEVIITFDAENEHPLDMQQQGWQAILNQFKLYTEGID